MAILLAQDPLGPLYPAVYRRAQEVERLDDSLYRALRSWVVATG